jgi:DNA-binding MarR family transcriptional regulator
MDNAWTTHNLADELLRVIPSMGRVMDRYIRELGEEETTIMQVRALFFIMENAVTASGLAKKRRVSLQAASNLVQGLVERGWVVRRIDPNDRRQFLLEVTPEGLKRAQTAREQMTAYLAGFLDELSAEEIATAQVFLPSLHRLLMGQMETDDLKQEKQASI